LEVVFNELSLLLFPLGNVVKALRKPLLCVALISEDSRFPWPVKISS